MSTQLIEKLVAKANAAYKELGVFPVAGNIIQIEHLPALDYTEPRYVEALKDVIAEAESAGASVRAFVADPTCYPKARAELVRWLKGYGFDEPPSHEDDGQYLVRPAAA